MATRPFVRHLKEMEILHHNDIEGYMYEFKDTKSVLDPCQYECVQRLNRTLLMEQEVYLMRNPEIIAMLKILIRKMNHPIKTAKLSEMAHHFTRPVKELDEAIRKLLNLSPEEAYGAKTGNVFKFDEFDLLDDLVRIIEKHYPRLRAPIPSPLPASSVTTSSSFLSGATSASTPATPEPEPVVMATLSQTFYILISNTVNKATMLKVTEYDIKYDIAYVELMNIVENAMELTVTDIKEDIATMYNMAYRVFEAIIIEKQRIADEIAWDNRMRKKLKRLLRRQKNFRGYETPPSTKSEVSLHPSYKLSPQRICVCHPKWKFNRYPKDRYGIYLPPDTKYNRCSTTLPPLELDELNE